LASCCCAHMDRPPGFVIRVERVASSRCGTHDRQWSASWKRPGPTIHWLNGRDCVMPNRSAIDFDMVRQSARVVPLRALNRGWREKTRSSESPRNLGASVGFVPARPSRCARYSERLNDELLSTSRSCVNACNKLPPSDTRASTTSGDLRCQG